MLTGLYGRAFTPDDYLELGKKTLASERRFNSAAGFTAAADRLPDFFKTEKLAPHDATFDVPDEELDKVYDFVK
ncbi:MAG: aldehyde ferredoxin oxidoreductase C-terminal domain-containing protein, partial [Planctomycetota bacterium]|jgi:aldehyde:ferredoxin oxidoreductase